MTLFQATLISGLAFLSLGAVLVWNGNPVKALFKRFPRSRRAAYITMGVASAWTLYKVSQLGEADFGNYKKLIFVGFAVLALASFKYAPDFLSVRGACMIFLLSAWVLLRAAFMQFDEPLRLFMVFPVYLGVAFSLYLAYSPFRLRDFLGWLFATGARVKIVGLSFFLYGGFLSGVAFAY